MLGDKTTSGQLLSKLDTFLSVPGAIVLDSDTH